MSRRSLLHRNLNRRSGMKVLFEERRQPFSRSGRKVKKGEKGIHLYRRNASLLAESLEVIQQTSAVILAGLQPPSAAEDEMPDAELAKVA